MTKQRQIQELIKKHKAKGEISTKKISDGHHTFGELYHHRMILFSLLCRMFRGRAWRSKLHDDGTMLDDSFITGIETPDGQYTYHYNLKDWDHFKGIRELPRAPKFDGHKPKDITRLLSLLEKHKGE